MSAGGPLYWGSAFVQLNKHALAVTEITVFSIMHRIISTESHACHAYTGHVGYVT
jgi:hypothetical protein